MKENGDLVSEEGSLNGVGVGTDVANWSSWGVWGGVCVSPPPLFPLYRPLHCPGGFLVFLVGRVCGVVTPMITMIIIVANVF